MDFTPEINALERAVDYLREVLAMPLEKLTKRQSRKVFSKMTEHIDDIYYIDDLMPLEEFADKFTDPADRKAFFRVLDLLDEAFSMLDEILGPEEEWDPETLGDYQQAKPSRRKNDDGDDYPAMPGTMPSDAVMDGSGEQAQDGAGEDPYEKLLRSFKPGRHAS